MHRRFLLLAKLLAAPLFLFLIVVCFYWKLVLTNQFTWLNSPDISSLVMPWMQFQAGEWHAWRFPLWDPYGWAGQPLFGQAQPGAAYPLNWLLFLMPLKHGWIRQSALHWYYVLIHYFAALSLYALCRDLKRSKAASVIAGCIFALGGYVATTDWPQLLNGAVWVPLVLLFLFRALDGRRPLANTVFSGTCMGIMWLAGHHQIQLFVTLALAALWLFLIFQEGRINWQIARLAAVFGIFMICGGAFQTLPTAEYGKLARRWGGAAEPQRFNEPVPYAVHKDYALNPNGLLGIVLPGTAKNTDPFMGIVAVSLGVLGVALGWYDRRLRWLTVLGLGSLLFALGPNIFMHGVLYSLVPIVEKARVPSASVLMFNLALAAASAYGIDLFFAERSERWARRVMLAAGSVGAILSVISLTFIAAQKPNGIPEERMMMTALFAVLLAVAIYAFRNRQITRRMAAASLLCLVTFELGNEATFWFPDINDKNRKTYLPVMAQNDDIAEFFREQPAPRRFTYDHDLIPYNIGDWYGMEAFEDYRAAVTTNLWQHDLWSQPMRNLLGIAYYVGNAPQRPDQKQVFQSSSGLRVYANAGVFPRTWAVHEAIQIPNNEGIVRQTLLIPSFDLRNKTFLTGKPPRLELCTGDEVSLTHFEPNQVTIAADMKCTGMVILPDTYFPGWRATVDGKSAPIFEAYAFARGVVVGAGKHEIEMRYQPISVYLGAFLTLLAIGTSLVFAWKGRKASTA